MVGRASERCVKIAAVLACYDRKATSLRCLQLLYASVPPGADLSVFLFDDASPDGTAKAVRKLFPEVCVIDGDGQQFWCGGMRAAMSAANTTHYDFLLWLNDDVELKPNALQTLLDAHQRAVLEKGKGPHVIVGAMADPRSGCLTYSGCRRVSKLHPAKLALIMPDSERLLPCDTMNGNCVLFPAAMVEAVGEIDPAYIQQIGDADYGYRCVEAGGSIWLAPGLVGTGTPNTHRHSWDNSALSFGQRLRILNTPHGLPLRPWLHFMYRFGGPVAVTLLFWNYFKQLSISLLPQRVLRRS